MLPWANVTAIIGCSLIGGGLTFLLISAVEGLVALVATRKALSQPDGIPAAY